MLIVWRLTTIIIYCIPILEEIANWWKFIKISKHWACNFESISIWISQFYKLIYNMKWNHSYTKPTSTIVKFYNYTFFFFLAHRETRLIFSIIIFKALSIYSYLKTIKLDWITTQNKNRRGMILDLNWDICAWLYCKRFFFHFTITNCLLSNKCL